MIKYKYEIGDERIIVDDQGVSPRLITYRIIDRKATLNSDDGIQIKYRLNDDGGWVGEKSVKEGFFSVDDAVDGWLKDKLEKKKKELAAQIRGARYMNKMQIEIIKEWAVKIKNKCAFK